MSGLVLSIFILATIIQLGFWILVFRKFATYEPKPSGQASQIPVSVVICAKNEALNLSQNLPKILNQKYPEFEVIVVDDRSEDHTQKILVELQKKHDCLNNIHLKSSDMDFPGKKFALARGLEAAHHEWVILTDADCIPAGDYWIANMIPKDDSDVVLGYGPIHKTRGFLNLWTRFETVITAIQYFSWALADKPYMGVGRNLGYKKELYKLDKLKPSIASGDDDLFIQSIQNKRIDININPSTFMYSKGKAFWTEYFKQKVRHVSTSFSYSRSMKIILGLFAFTHLIFWILYFCISVYINFKFALLSILIKWTVQVFVFNKCSLILQDKILTKWFPLLDLCLAVYYVMLTPLLFFYSRNRW